MQLRSLPPLDLIVPFEAAARLGSFTRAASELNVTQSAVSQRVRSLEDHLGVALFVRAHRKITLTAQGHELLNSATAALQHLTAATNSIQSTDEETRLRLAADTSITAMWLMPEIEQFRAANPDIVIDLTASDSEEDCLSADVAILHGEGMWLGFDAVKLFSDEVFPVCSTDYLATHPVESLTDLLTVDLIDLDYQHWNWMNWGIWLTEKGLDPARVRRGFQSNSYPAGIAMARSGLGVALGWNRFVDRDLADGTLIRPLPDQVATRFGYFLALREDAPEPARRFRAWMQQG